MNRILALQGLTGTSFGPVVMAGSNQSVECSSESAHCSSQSIGCGRPKPMLMVAW
jgi:hypothetical protein